MMTLFEIRKFILIPLLLWNVMPSFCHLEFNLQVLVFSNTTAKISWNPLRNNKFEQFNLKLLNLNNTNDYRAEAVFADNGSYIINHLTAGTSYELEFCAILFNIDVGLCGFQTFTTIPNTPGNMISIIEDETNLIIGWSGPIPRGKFHHYVITIHPSNQRKLNSDKVVYTSFDELIPGTMYKIDVQTISGYQTSLPATIKLRTKPPKPLNLRINTFSLGPNSFEVAWDHPNVTCKFDKYQISLADNLTDLLFTWNYNKISLGKNISSWKITDLQPGKKYKVLVETVSGNISSLPSYQEVVMKPLSVQKLFTRQNISDDRLLVFWEPSNMNYQGYDTYFKLIVTKTSNFKEYQQSFSTTRRKMILDDVYGKTVKIDIFAVSNGVLSDPNTIIVYGDEKRFDKPYI